MIEKQTVLILGAGASWPYGLPLGGELRDYICGVGDVKNTLAADLLNHADITIDETKNFSRQFKRSNLKSIDAFLAKRGEFAEIGKLAIAASLIIKEDSEKLISAATKENWYSYLWNLMIPGINNHREIFEKNKIAFITFNYDRSLEYFLHTSLKNSFGVNDQVAMGVLRQANILHLYGYIGAFDCHPANGARQYLSDLNEFTLRTAAGGIKTIPEARENDEVFMIARRLCLEAEKIGFLGFGFDYLNAARLDLVGVLKSRLESRNSAPRIVASTLGETISERAQYQRLVCPNNSWEPMDKNSLMTLRESGLLFD